MPKISKASRITPGTSTKPGSPPPEKDKLDKYICTRCGKIYVRQKSNFPASQSSLYNGGGGYLTVCYHCMDNLFDHYKQVLGSGEAAMERLCMKFDIYWNPDLYGMINKINSSASRVKSYVSKTFLMKYLGKTYDDTMDEQSMQNLPIQVVTNEDGEEESVDIIGTRSDVNTDSVLFWGSGFDAESYKELDMKFERWTKDLPKPLPIVDESLYKQICIQELQINRNIAAGKDVEKGQNALNSLLGSLKLKPSQKRDDDSVELDIAPLGVWTKRWEEKRPIPEDDPDMEDVHGLKKYISVWLYGHLGKALGLKNTYSQLYEQEMDKYRVEKPEFEDEEDDVIITEMFGDSGGDSP